MSYPVLSFQKVIKSAVFTIVMVASSFAQAIANEQSTPEVLKAQVGDVEIAYYIRGTGKPLLMINGYKSSMSKWDPALLEQLEQHYQLILFDNRGIGFSTDSVEDKTTMSQMADDAAGLAKALGFNEIYALGWSMGARIGQQLAIRHPDLVKKLILCAPNPGGKHQVPATPETLAKLNNPLQTEEEALELFFSPTPEGKKAALDYKRRVDAAIASGKVPNDTIVSAQAIERQNRARGELWNALNSNYESLSKIAIPTLVADGKSDVVDLPENVPIIANQIPFAWTAYFEGGHGFLFEDSQRFSDLVRVFLQ